MSKPDTLDLDALADLIAERERDRAEAKRRAALAGGPCHWCGLGETIESRGWRNEHGQAMCGRCAGWFDQYRMDRLDLAAAALCGLATWHQRTSPSGLADALGLVPWGDTGRTEANAVPWGHADIAAMRERLQTLSQYKRPEGWSAEAKVVW